jgi:1-aminocyclopropane-1-carboxylate deaminase
MGQLHINRLDIMIKLYNSPIQNITFQNQSFLIKRDDLLDTDFSGNKARKFHYFLVNEFPNIDTVISYGSNQSNAMYSLSVLCKFKKWNFIYYVDHISGFLTANPDGNYKYALENGMSIRIFANNQTIADIEYDSTTTLLINEGGANIESQYGIEILANEIRQYKDENKIQDLKIFLPSGTGTTAFFLQKYIRDEVLTTPCVGDVAYLKKQFLDLERDESIHPTIIPADKKYHFGKLYKENYKLWKALKETTNIEFDLLYDPVGMKVFLELEKEYNCQYLYIHQGGIIGNETMIKRYQFKFKDI